MQMLAVLLLGLLHCSLGALVNHKSLRNKRAHSKSVGELPPFYHTTDAIHQELVELAKGCPGMTLESKSADTRSIDVVTIKGPGTKPVNKIFMLFGEHARELISPESSLHFIKTLCGEVGNKERTASVLQDSEFQIVVNGNPESRQRVEEGDFCLRVNPNGVDLNRNWDEHWEPSNDVFGMTQTNSGPHAFSEPETQVFKELVSAYDPSTFLTIHSGTKGMYMPWAYDMKHLATRNQPAMMNILKTLDKDHCECPFGAAGKEVGYSCPGTCLDWVYDKLKTPYAFAFEIYTDPSKDDELKEQWSEKMENGGAFYQAHSQLGNKHFKDVFTKFPSDFVQVEAHHRHRHRRHKEPDECFANFNPDTEERYNSTVQNWSEAYLDMAEMVAHNLKQGK